MLMADGVAPMRLSAVGYGEYHPALPNATPDGRNANRRVVLAVETSASDVAAPPAAAAPAAAAAAAEGSGQAGGVAQ